LEIVKCTIRSSTRIWKTSTNIIILSWPKNRPVYFSRHNISETGFCLRLQVKPT
jgi:hypothetical protein